MTAILHSIVLMLLLSLSCPTSPHLYNVSYLASFLTMWTLRISVFYNLLLFVIRTINIVSPFYIIKRRLVLSSLITIPWIPWFPIIVHQFYTTMEYQGDDYMSYKMRILSSSYLVGDSIVNETLRLGHYPVILICVVLPFVLPSLISIFSLSLQLKSLVLEPSPRCDRDTDREKIKAAVTILLLTLLFSICNTSCVSFWISVCLNENSTYLSSRTAVWVYVTGVTMPFLHSAVSPTILIWRGHSIKNMVSDFVRR